MEKYKKVDASEPQSTTENHQDVLKKHIANWIKVVGGRDKKGRLYGMPYLNWGSMLFGVPPQMPAPEQEAHQQKADARIEKIEQLLTQQMKLQSQQMHRMQQSIMQQSQQMMEIQQVLLTLIQHSQLTFLQKPQPPSIFQQYPQSSRVFGGGGGDDNGDDDDDDDDGGDDGDNDDDGDDVNVDDLGYFDN